MTYLIIAAKVGLDEVQRTKFCFFMGKRFAGQEHAVCMGGIAERWANIVKAGSENQYASDADKAIFAQVPPLSQTPIAVPVAAPVADKPTFTQKIFGKKEEEEEVQAPAPKVEKKVEKKKKK